MDKAIHWIAHQVIHCGLHEGVYQVAHEYTTFVNSTRAQKSPYEDLENKILSADDVSIDFAAWSANDLNLNTTCHACGISNGDIRFAGHIGVKKATCNSLEYQKIVIHLYKWCRARAPGVGDEQRSFRFRKGKYAGEGKFVSTALATGVPGGAVALLGVGALFS